MISSQVSGPGAWESRWEAVRGLGLLGPATTPGEDDAQSLLTPVGRAAVRTPGRPAGQASQVAGQPRAGSGPLTRVRSLGPRADFVPAIADGVFEAVPGVGVARFPVAAGVGFERRPVLPPVALVRAQLVAIAVGGLILRIGRPPADKRRGVVLLEEGTYVTKS